MYLQKESDLTVVLRGVELCLNSNLQILFSLLGTEIFPSFEHGFIRFQLSFILFVLAN